MVEIVEVRARVETIQGKFDRLAHAAAKAGGEVEAELERARGQVAVYEEMLRIECVEDGMVCAMSLPTPEAMARARRRLDELGQEDAEDCAG